MDMFALEFPELFDMIVCKLPMHDLLKLGAMCRHFRVLFAHVRIHAAAMKPVLRDIMFIPRMYTHAPIVMSCVRTHEYATIYTDYCRYKTYIPGKLYSDSYIGSWQLISGHEDNSCANTSYRFDLMSWCRMGYDVTLRQLFGVQRVKRRIVRQLCMRDMFMLALTCHDMHYTVRTELFRMATRR